MNVNNETNESVNESQEIKSNVTLNIIENNLTSNSFDPGTSSFSTVNSTPSYVTGTYHPSILNGIIIKFRFITSIELTDKFILFFFVMCNYTRFKREKPIYFSR
jgi:hypothetical protein